MKKLLFIVVLVAFVGCKVTAEQQAKRAVKKAERIANRTYADSVRLAERHNYMIEQQGQNFPESQDQDHE